MDAQTAAIDALCAAFDGIDRAVVETVYQSEGGSAERAAEALLVLAGDESAIAEVAERQQHAVPPAGVAPRPPPDMPMQRGAPQARNAMQAPPGAYIGTLPPDFLSLGPVGTVDPSMTRQMMEDEQLARMLQNEEFMLQLQGNAEIARSLNASGQPDAAAPAGSEGAAPAAQNEVSFREKLSNASEATKEKIRQLYSKWTKGRSTSARYAPVDDSAAEGLELAEMSSDDDDLLDEEGLNDNRRRMTRQKSAVKGSSHLEFQ